MKSELIEHFVGIALTLLMAALMWHQLREIE